MAAPNGSIVIRIDGDPKPQPRARARIIGKHAGVYNPDTNAGWRECVAVAGKAVRPVRPLDGPIRVDAVFIFRRPKGHYSTGAKGGLKKSAPVYWHTVARGPYGGDRDNMDKTILDVLTQCGFWKDDGLVCWGQIIKRWQGVGERPGAVVVITPLEDVEPGGWLAELDREMAQDGDPGPAVRKTPPSAPTPKKADPVRAFTDLFCEMWAAAHGGERYPFHGNKDRACAERLFDFLLRDMEKSRRLFALYLKDKDDFPVRAGHSLAVLSATAVLTRYLALLANPAPAARPMDHKALTDRIAAHAKAKEADRG